MEIRAYDPDRDLTDAVRMWREVGWITDDSQEKVLPRFLEDARAIVAEQDGHAECMVTVHDGRIRIDTADLPLAVVSSVTTSLVGRRKGYARRMCADQLRAEADRGDALAILGMFDQGFYDKVGFGTGASMLRQQFDPGLLTVDVPTRTPVRLSADDAAEIHAANQRRLRAHGGVTMSSPAFTAGELSWDDDPLVALGFRDDAGELTHYFWGASKGEHGPWHLFAMVYRDTSQLLELLGLLRLVSDQIRGVWLPEPPEVVLEDLIDQPGRHRYVTKGGTNAAEVTGGAWWQARILDLPAVVAALQWEGKPVRFRVDVDDPLADGSGTTWDGVHGLWEVTLGQPSNAVRSDDDTLPVLTAGVGAFSRLLLGVASATSLALTDALGGPPELLSRLDRAVQARDPNPGMYF